MKHLLPYYSKHSNRYKMNKMFKSSITTMHPPFPLPRHQFVLHDNFEFSKCDAAIQTLYVRQK